MFFLICYSDFFFPNHCYILHFDFAKTGTWLPSAAVAPMAVGAKAARFWHRLFKIGIQLV
jgi:hypothetical protein